MQLTGVPVDSGRNEKSRQAEKPKRDEDATTDNEWSRNRTPSNSAPCFKIRVGLDEVAEGLEMLRTKRGDPQRIVVEIAAT
jgi:hypothetical protein